MARKTTRIRQQSPPAGRRCRVGHRCRRQEGPAERVRSSFLSPVREHRQLDTDDVAAAGTDSAESDRSASNSTLSSSPRSEEHTSELQSLMRISYAVFCLKKKNKKLTTISVSI